MRIENLIVIAPKLTHRSSMMDSTVSLKVKIAEGKRIGACFLACNTLKVEGCGGTLGWD